MAILKGPVNFMNQLIFHPCSRPFYAYVVTFIPAFIEAFLTTRVLDLEDIFRDKARDFAGAGSRASRRSLRHTRKMLFHPDGGKAERISHRALVTALKWSQPLENLGYKLLVIGAADQLFYRWTSLLEIFTFCNAPFATGPLSRTRTPGSTPISPVGAALALPIEEQDRANWSSTGVSAGTPAGLYFFAFNATLSSKAGTLQGVSLRVEHSGAIGFQDSESEEQDLHENQPTDFILTGYVVGPFGGGITWTWQVVGPLVPIGVNVTEASFFLIRQELT